MKSSSIKVGDEVQVTVDGLSGYTHNLKVGARGAVVSFDADGYVGIRLGAATGFAPLFCLSKVAK